MSVAAAVAMTAALAVLPGAAGAAEPLILPPGVACSFGLQVEIVSGDHRVNRTFVDANGNTVRILEAGYGNQLTFTNTSTGSTLTLPANGSVSQTVINADGSKTVTLSGHNVLILFPTDVPAGPSTTLYVGRVVFTIDVNGDYTLVSTSGTARDICAELS
jgi:hypothetical protein